MEPPRSVKMDSFKRIQSALLTIGPKSYPIFKGVNTVGRNKTAIVNIKHLNVSQNQAVFVLVDDNQHYVSDLNSSNGTFLHNSKLIPFKLYELMNGVEIKFGDVSAVYSKIPRNARLNLQQTLDTTEMTQDMTQNFYTSNTQLMFNNKDIGDHSYFNAESSNSIVQSIHEEATQVVENPLHLSNTEVMDNNTQSQFQSCVVIEERVDDIHDAPTQVVCMTEQINSKISPKKPNIQKGPSQVSENSSYSKDIHEAPTQVVGCSENKDKEKPRSQSAWATQTLNTQDLIQAINLTINSGDSNTQELSSQEKQELIDRVDKKNQDDNKAKVVEIDSNEDIQKPPSLETLSFSKNLILIPFQKKNVIHDSQTPSTSKAFPPSEYDESFLNATKTSKGEIIEETIIENTDSNESIDFLSNTQDGVNKLISENTQSTTDNETPEIGFRKKSAKPIQTQETDSGTDLDDKPVKQLSTQESVTDVDDEETIEFRKTPVKQLFTQDSETNIESQQIGFKKKPAKPLSEDSDSDTDIDDTIQNSKPDEQHKISNSDSETDCEDEILQKLNHIESNQHEMKDDICTDIENNKNEMNDSRGTKDDICTNIASNQNEMNESDCIPATQDAFAEALGYAAIRSQQTNQSSEESFKLGLTELMDYSETVTENNNDKDEIEDMPKTDGHVNQEVAKMDETETEKIYLMPTQKMEVNNSSKKFTFKKKSCTLNESLTSLLNNNRNKGVVDDVIEADDSFLQPTQKLDTETSEQPEADDDIFLQPTQKLDTETSEKPRTSVGGFLQPRKPIKKKANKNNTELKKVEEDSDDVFLQPTQKLVLEEPVDPSEPLDLKKGSSRIPNTQDDDVYMVATQKIQEDADKKTEEIPMTQEDLYGQATQKLNTASQETDTVTENQDVYDLQTQQINGVSNIEADTQLEMPFNSQTTHFKIIEESHRPGNPILRELDHQSNHDEEVGSSNKDNLPKTSLFKQPIMIRDNTKSKADKPETLSQIDAFIKKPLPPTDTRRSVRKSNLDQNDEAVETMSQIEAFVEEPASNKSELGPKKLSKDEDPPETLSQIATFIRKPLPKTQEPIKDDEFERFSRSLYKRTSVNSTTVGDDLVINIRTIREDEHLLSSSKSSDEALNDSERSKEVKSDIDQSFALLESKNSKVKRKPKQDTVFNEFKVAVTSHRRSMGLAENSTPNIVVPIKKMMSNKKNSSELSSIEESAKVPRGRWSRKPSTSSEPEKRMSVRGKQSEAMKSNSEETKDSDTGGGNSKASTKAPSTRKSRKASTSSEPEPAPRKSRKLSSNELEKISARGKKAEESMEIIAEENKQLIGSSKGNNENKNKEVVPKKSKIIVKGQMVDSSIDGENNETIKHTNASKDSPKSTKTASKTNVSDSSEENAGSSKTIEESKKGTVKLKKLSNVDKKSAKNQPHISKEVKDSAKTNKRISKRRLSNSSESDFIPTPVEHTNASKEPHKSTRTGPKTHVSESSEENADSSNSIESNTEVPSVGKRNFKKPAPSKEVEDSSKTDKRVSKRQLSSSSEGDFVPSGPSTPVKRGRLSAKVNNVLSNDTSSKSRDSSVTSGSMATPRKGRIAVKTESLLASAERSKRKQKPKVVFTMLDSPQLESYIKHLGGSIVDTVESCTVLVTQSIKRSQKLLTAVAQGKPICSPEWIRSSKQNNDFLDPWDFLLVDKESEKKWDFSLRESLIKATDNKLFEGYIFQLMVNNALDVLKGSIEASGGKIVTKQPGKSELDSFIIIATADQKSKFQRIKKQHPEVSVIEPEAIFDGVLRQEFRLSRHLIA